jgi:hypothetical protein
MDVKRFLEQRTNGLRSSLRHTKACEKELKGIRTLYQNELDGVLDLIELRNNGQNLILPQAYEDLIYNILKDQSLNGRDNTYINYYLRAFVNDCPQEAIYTSHKRKDTRLSGILSEILGDNSFSRDALEYIRENPNYSIDLASRIPVGAPAPGYKPLKKDPTNRKFYDSHSSPSQESGIRELEDSLSLS